MSLPSAVWDCWRWASIQGSDWSVDSRGVSTRVSSICGWEWEEEAESEEEVPGGDKGGWHKWVWKKRTEGGMWTEHITFITISALSHYFDTSWTSFNINTLGSAYLLVLFSEYMGDSRLMEALNSKQPWYIRQFQKSQLSFHSLQHWIADNLHSIQQMEVPAAVFISRENIFTVDKFS